MSIPEAHRKEIEILFKSITYVIMEAVTRIEQIKQPYKDLGLELKDEKRKGEGLVDNKYEISKPNPLSQAFREFVSTCCGTSQSGYFWYGPDEIEKTVLQEYLLKDSEYIRSCLPYYFNHKLIISDDYKGKLKATVKYLNNVLPYFKQGDPNILFQSFQGYISGADEHILQTGGADDDEDLELEEEYAKI